MTWKRCGLLAAVLLSAGLPALAADDDSSAERFRFHGEVRFRGDYQDNYLDFDDQGPAGSLAFWPFRARLAGEVDVTDTLTGQVEFQVAEPAGLTEAQRDVLTTPDEPFDLYTAYIHWDEVGNPNLSMRFGRQELDMGNEFLFGDLDFYNGTSFDAYRLHWGDEGMTFDFWWAHFRETFGGKFDGDIGTLAFGGTGDEGGSWSFYAHAVRDDGPSGIDRETLLVFGFRTTQVSRGANRFLWNFEFAWQDGRIGNPSELDSNGNPTGITLEDIFISAWGGEGLFGYNFHVAGSDHQVYGHAYLATGDRERGNRDDNNFRPLFQDFHRRLGRADLVQGTNINVFGLVYEGTFRDKHTAGVNLMAFRINRPVQTDTQLASVAGSFDGVVIEATDVSGLPDEDELGEEIDLWYDYYYNDHLSFDVALSFFAPGAAITNTQLLPDPADHLGDDPVTRLTAQARLRF